MADRASRHAQEAVLQLLTAAMSVSAVLTWGVEADLSARRLGVSALSARLQRPLDPLPAWGAHLDRADPHLQGAAGDRRHGLVGALLAVSVAFFLATAFLLFVYMRRRVDPWLALLATTIVLFLVAAFDNLLWDFQMGFTGSLACGLGALLLLDGYMKKTLRRPHSPAPRAHLPGGFGFRRPGFRERSSFAHTTGARR